MADCLEEALEMVEGDVVHPAIASGAIVLRLDRNGLQVVLEYPKR